LLNAGPLLVADLAALGGTAALTCGLASLYSADLPGEMARPLMLAALIFPVIFGLSGLYAGTGRRAVAELAQLALAMFLLLSVILVSAYLDSVTATGMLTLLIASLCLPVSITLTRAAVRAIVSRFQWWGQPVLVFGSGETARQLYHYFLSRPSLGMRPLAVIDRSSEAPSDSGLRPRCPLPDFAELLRRRHRVSWAVVTTSLSPASAETVRGYLAAFPHVLIVPDTEDLPGIRRQMFDCGNFAAIPMTNSLLLGGPRAVKRFMDCVLVIGGGIVCLPLIGVIAALIKLTSRGPVFYSQNRIGKGHRTFKAWKFRTMIVNADAVLQDCLSSDQALREEWERDHKLKNDPRVTRIGRWLRKTSLDELPQIWNVLRGEMSLVGPRPIVDAEIAKYGNWFELYSKVTPGITGLWQISGRNNTTYDRRVAFDRYYVLNWSPWLDLYILVRTIHVVLSHDGAY
jgi:Undecaprenyl-phosphate galactose phosphotransferase WbaP